MKLVTTSVAVSAILLSLGGAALAQVQLDPGAQGRTRSTVSPSEGSGMSGGAAGSATTGAGVKANGAKAGAGASGQGSATGSAGSGGTAVGVGASGKARGSTPGN